MSNNTMSRWGRWPAICALGLFLALTGRAPEAPAALPSVSPIPPGAARIWFYRDYEPYVSRNYAPVSLNGATVGYARPDGSAFYRDVAPGYYHITVLSQGLDVNQDGYVTLAPGQQAFVKILATNIWESGGGTESYSRDTFYVTLVPPPVAEAELATRPITGG
jgi:hypothetical protein